ncbi:MAG: hypothetical protein DSY59_05065 [Persephonella sp.]|nr:MAG: hypothetical protein DSY59_05065 [Persephonella sp.]
MRIKNIRRKLFPNILTIYRILIHNKLRFALSVLGVVFGTFALIVMVSVSTGMKEKNKREIEKLGKNPIVVKSGKVFVFRKKSKNITTSTTLKLSQVKILKEQIPEIKRIIPAFNVDYPVRYKGKTIFTTIIGTTTDYLDYKNLVIKEGRFFTKEEEKVGAKVVVLGSKIAEKFFDNGNPLGKEILIFRVPCKVIGVLDDMGTDLAGTDQDILIYTPLKTAMRRLSNVDYINTVYIEVNNQKNIPIVKQKIKQLLRKLHHLKPTDKDDFTVLTPDELLFMQKKAMYIFTTLGYISAGISFLIGGIGILSIMVLIVYERIEEIGIRRSVGAKKSDILLQFLIETVFISTVGGAIGVLLGYALSYVITNLFKIPFIVDYRLLIGAFLLSFFTGVLAGIYPAYKGATINIISALKR